MAMSTATSFTILAARRLLPKSFTACGHWAPGGDWSDWSGKKKRIGLKHRDGGIRCRTNRYIRNNYSLYWILLNIIEYYWILLNIIEYYWMILNDTDRISWICQICIDMSYVVSAQKSWTDTPGAYSHSPIFLLTPPICTGYLSRRRWWRKRRRSWERPFNRDLKTFTSHPMRET
jgi:hypothetical protein